MRCTVIFIPEKKKLENYENNDPGTKTTQIHARSDPQTEGERLSYGPATKQPGSARGICRGRACIIGATRLLSVCMHFKNDNK